MERELEDAALWRTSWSVSWREFQDELGRELKD